MVLALEYFNNNNEKKKNIEIVMNSIECLCLCYDFFLL